MNKGTSNEAWTLIQIVDKGSSLLDKPLSWSLLAFTKNSKCAWFLAEGVAE